MFHSFYLSYDFYYIDMEADFIVKMVQIKGRDNSNGKRSRDLEIFVGDTPPPKTTAPVDKTKNILCAKIPYQMATSALNGATCNKWTIGRYVIVQNNRPAWMSGGGYLQIVEFGVWGFFWNDFENSSN